MWEIFITNINSVYLHIFCTKFPKCHDCDIRNVLLKFQTTSFILATFTNSFVLELRHSNMFGNSALRDIYRYNSMERVVEITKHITEHYHTTGRCQIKKFFNIQKYIKCKKYIIVKIVYNHLMVIHFYVFCPSISIFFQRLILLLIWKRSVRVYVIL